MTTLAILYAIFGARARARKNAHVKVPCDTCRGVAWDIDLLRRTAVPCPYCGHRGGPRLAPTYNCGAGYVP